MPKLFIRPSVKYDAVSNKTEFQIGLSNKKGVLVIKVKGDMEFLLSDKGQERLLEAAKFAKEKLSGISTDGAYHAMVASLYLAAGGQIVSGSGLGIAVPRPTATAEKSLLKKLQSPDRKERIDAARTLIVHEAMQKVINDPDFKKLNKEFTIGYRIKLGNAVDDLIKLMNSKDPDKYWDRLVEDQKLRSEIAQLVFEYVKNYPETYYIYKKPS